jgi:hypothetical protein
LSNGSAAGWNISGLGSSAPRYRYGNSGYGYGNGYGVNGYGYNGGYGGYGRRNSNYVWVYLPGVGWVRVPAWSIRRW